MYRQVTEELRLAYDRMADERDKKAISPWKQYERQAFLQMLQREGKETLLEIGAGPGRDSLFFQENGLRVISTDLSPQMVRLCRDKGIEAYEMDFLNLSFTDARFDSIYALNCLLHVPKADLGPVLHEIRRVLKMGGLFFLGLHGGIDHDGLWEDDKYDPKRHFSLYTDEQILKIIGNMFHVRDFKIIELPDGSRPEMHFQRFILQKVRDKSAQPTV